MSSPVVLLVVLFGCWRSVLFVVLLVSSTSASPARNLSCSLSCSCPVTKKDTTPDPRGRGVLFGGDPHRVSPVVSPLSIAEDVMGGLAATVLVQRPEPRGEARDATTSTVVAAPVIMIEQAALGWLS